MFHFPSPLSSDQVAHLRDLDDSSCMNRSRVFWRPARGFKFSEKRDIPRKPDAHGRDTVYVVLEYWEDPHREQEAYGPDNAFLDEDGIEVTLAQHLEKQAQKIGCSKTVVKHVKFNTVDYLLDECPECEAEGQNVNFDTEAS